MSSFVLYSYSISKCFKHCPRLTFPRHYNLPEQSLSKLWYRFSSAFVKKITVSRSLCLKRKQPILDCSWVTSRLFVLLHLFAAPEVTKTLHHAQHLACTSSMPSSPLYSPKWILRFLHTSESPQREPKERSKKRHRSYPHVAEGAGVSHCASAAFSAASSQIQLFNGRMSKNSSFSSRPFPSLVRTGIFLHTISSCFSLYNQSNWHQDFDKSCSLSKKIMQYGNRTTNP